MKAFRYPCLALLLMVVPSCDDDDETAPLPGISDLEVLPAAGGAELSWTSAPGALDYRISYGATPAAKRRLLARTLSGTASTDGRVAVILQDLPPGTAYFSVEGIFDQGIGPAVESGSLPVLVATPLPRDGIDGEMLGWSVAWIGDVDGDGRSDFVVGAREADPGGRANAGIAYVVSGSSGSVIHTKEGIAAGDGFGWTVSGTGDVDGDGVPDFLVGAPLVEDAATEARGAAYLFSGATGAVVWTKLGESETDARHLGEAVGPAGDVNADGRMDFIVGAPPSLPQPIPRGSAFVYSGLDGSRLHRFDGENPGDQLGNAVGGGGDIDGDGVADLVVGAMFHGLPGTNGVGAVYVYSGATGDPIHQWTGPNVDSFELGASVSIAGDVDADGRCDVVVGALGPAPHQGIVRVYSGATGTVILEAAGLTAGPYLGSSVDAAGDVNGDGHADVIAGMMSGAPPGQGHFRVFSGANGSVLYDVDSDIDDQVGFDVAGGGDANGDGLSDLLAGAPYAIVGGVINSGTAYLFRTDGELGLVPGESINPQSLSGFDPLNLPRVSASGNRTFLGSGGTAPYQWTLLTDRSGAILDASGSYTAGAVANVYDTVRVSDALGRSRDTRVWVGPAGTPPPAPLRPGSLRALLVGATSIDMAWTDRSTGETGFVLEARTPTNPWAVVQTLPADSDSLLLTGLDADKTYLFRLKAVDAVGDSQWSSVAITTLPAPSGLTSTGSTSTSIDLAWTDNSGAETSFEIQKRADDASASWVPAGSVGENVTSFSVTGLDPATFYQFRVRGVTGVLQSSWSNAVTSSTP